VKLSDISSEKVKIGILELVERSLGAVSLSDVMIFYEKKKAEVEQHFKDRKKIEDYAYMMLKRRLTSGCDIGDSWP